MAPSLSQDLVTDLYSWSDADEGVSDSDREAAAMLIALLEPESATTDEATDQDHVIQGATELRWASSGAEKKRLRLDLPPAIQARCEGTIGDWCGRFLMQTPVAVKVCRMETGMNHFRGQKTFPL